MHSATKRKGGWIVAMAILSGLAVLVPSMIALATSVFAVLASVLQPT